MPYVIGDHKKFKILYKDLKTLNFPIYLVKRFVLYEANRWDIETKNDKIIKLPSRNYKDSLKEYLDIRTKNEFSKYKIFDFRIQNQLILK